MLTGVWKDLLPGQHEVAHHVRPQDADHQVQGGLWALSPAGGNFSVFLLSELIYSARRFGMPAIFVAN